MVPESDIQEVIYFYLAHEDFGYFSNFSRHSVFLKGKRWPTAEHYFQAQKFHGTVLEEQIRCSAKPGDAARLGRSRAYPIRADWEQVKEDVMYDALLAKFTQRKELRTALLDTRGKLLVEHTVKDSYWGDGGDGSGQNRLGCLLMRVRDKLSGDTTVIPATLPTTTQPATQNTEEKSGSSGEGSTSEGDSEESETESESASEGEGGEKIEGIPPNHNHRHTLDASSLASEGIKDARARRRIRSAAKTKAKRSAFRDEDGASKLEKTNHAKGSVTVIGDGTIFSEKALPPQAKSVVNKHQKQRKYRPEALVEDEDDDTPVPTRPNTNFISEFVDRSITYAPEEIEEAEAYQLALVASIQAKEEDERKRKEEEKAQKIEKEIAECVEAAKSNMELLSTLTGVDEDLLVTVQTTCVGLRNTLSKYITEFSDTDNTEQLSLAMDQLLKLQSVC